MESPAGAGRGCVSPGLDFSCQPQDRHAHHPDQYTHFHAVSDPHPDAYCDGNLHAHSQPHSHGDCHPNLYPHCHSDQDIHYHAHPYLDGNPYTHRDSYTHPDPYGDPDLYPDSHTIITLLLECLVKYPN